MVQLLFVDLRPMNRLESLGGDPVLGPYVSELVRLVAQRENEIGARNKKGMALANALKILPEVSPSSTDVDCARIRIGRRADLDEPRQADLQNSLQRLKPWRKGPFEIFGIPLESEWDSSIKWDRLAGHLESQAGKRILDIGSSCGYYMFRMAAQKPALILGLEPYLNFYFQFQALWRYLPLENLHCLPLKLDELPVLRRCFDTVLCMGILYHRRSPLDTLLQIHQLMVPEGQLVLETLIMEGEGEVALFPEKRYARMKNVFFIPTVACVTHWLQRTGFADIRCVDIAKTTTSEQRKTDWIDTRSLEDFLDPLDSSKTVEGYPAPVRAMVLATAARR
jgi:tRNA (mo5U34)-methyltransferase